MGFKGMKIVNWGDPGVFSCSRLFLLVIYEHCNRGGIWEKKMTQDDNKRVGAKNHTNWAMFALEIFFFWPSAFHFRNNEIFFTIKFLS